jgi:hypothetical protein
VDGLGLREICQQLARAHVGRAPRRPPVEPIGVPSWPHGVDAERAHLPHGPAGDVAAHVLSAHRRNVVAQPRREGLDELPAVLVLLRHHISEVRRRVGVAPGDDRREAGGVWRRVDGREEALGDGADRWTSPLGTRSRRGRTGFDPAAYDHVLETFHLAELEARLRAVPLRRGTLP